MVRKTERPYRRDDDKSHLKCTHCGGTRHTKNECFKLVGYLEWWPDAKKKVSKPAVRTTDQIRTIGRAAVGQGVTEELTIDEQKKETSVALMGVSGSREEEGTITFSNGPNEGDETLVFRREGGDSLLNKGTNDPSNEKGSLITFCFIYFQEWLDFRL